MHATCHGRQAWLCDTTLRAVVQHLCSCRSNDRFLSWSGYPRRNRFSDGETILDGLNWDWKRDSFVSSIHELSQWLLVWRYARKIIPFHKWMRTASALLKTWSECFNSVRILVMIMSCFDSQFSMFCAMSSNGACFHNCWQHTVSLHQMYWSSNHLFANVVVSSNISPSVHNHFITPDPHHISLFS